MRYFIDDNWKGIAALSVLAIYAVVVFSTGFVIGQAAFYIAMIGTIVIKTILYLKERFF